jgi:hypothetical protein
MYIMRYLLVFSIFITGCVCLNPDHKKGTPPTVQTERVINNLKDAKEELVKAGEANTEIGKSVNKALTLAERLDVILEELEKSQNKNVVKPE